MASNEVFLTLSLLTGLVEGVPNLVKINQDGTIQSTIAINSVTRQGATLQLDPNGVLLVKEEEYDLVIGFDSTIVAGGTLSLVSPFGGNNMVFKQLVVTMITTAAGAFAELRGNVSQDRCALWPTDLAIEHRFGPVLHRLANTGDGIEIHSVAAASIRCSGTLYYRVFAAGEP